MSLTFGRLCRDARDLKVHNCLASISWRVFQILPSLQQSVVQKTEEESEPHRQGACGTGRSSCKALCGAGVVAYTACIGHLPQVCPSSYAPFWSTVWYSCGAPSVTLHKGVQDAN